MEQCLGFDETVLNAHTHREDTPSESRQEQNSRGTVRLQDQKHSSHDALFKSRLVRSIIFPREKKFD